MIKRLIKLVGFTLIMSMCAYLAINNMEHQVKELKHELMLQKRRNKIDSLRMVQFNQMVNSIEENENNELKILEEELLTDKYGIAVQKGNKELLDVINEVLKEMMDNGEIEEYTIKYLGE